MFKALSLSIVIPVYNEQSHLEACLEAISRQTSLPEEVLVVDNNSTDDSVKIAKRFKFVTVINEPQQGVTFARNTGFDAAKSDIIGRIDADTRLKPDWAEKVRKIFATHSMDAVTGPVGYYDMPLVPVGERLDHLIRQHINKPYTKKAVLFGTNMALTREAWQEVKGDVCFMNDIFEDVDLAIHLHKRNKIVRYDKRMVAFMSSRRMDDNPKNFYRYIKAYRLTYYIHDLPIGTATKAMSIYLLAYIALKPLRYIYDHENERFSLRKIMWPSIPEARKNPME